MPTFCGLFLLSIRCWREWEISDWLGFKREFRQLFGFDVDGVDYAAPRTVAEKHVASVWADVLSIDDVGVHDNFFEIGGHSLLAVRAIARLRAAFGVELSIASLFEHPTVAEFAQQLAKQSGLVTLSL